MLWNTNLQSDNNNVHLTNMCQENKQFRIRYQGTLLTMHYFKDTDVSR